MSSKRNQKNPDENPDDAVRNLTPKGGIHDTTIHVMRVMNQEHFKHLPVMLSEDNSEISKTQRGNSETLSATTSSFDVSEHTTSQLSHEDVTDSQSSIKIKGKDNERTSTPGHGLDDDIAQQLSNKGATDDISIIPESLHIIDKSGDVSKKQQPELENIKAVHSVDTSGSYGDTDTMTISKLKASGKFTQHSRSITKRLSPSLKARISKPMQLKTLQFKTHQMKLKTLSRVKIFKALQFKEQSPIPSQKHFLKPVQYKLLDSKQNSKKTPHFEAKIAVPLTDTEPENLYILRPLKFVDDSEPINSKITECKPLQLDEKNPPEERESKTQLTKPSEQRTVLKPLFFFESDTKLQPAYLEPVPGTSKLPSLPAKPVILKPLHFYQKAMGPVHFFDECETGKTSILSPKLKVLTIPKILQSTTEIETGHRSVLKAVKFTGDIEPIQLAESIELDTKHLKDVKKIQSYSLDAESVVFSQPVQSYSPSDESAEIQQFSELAPPYSLSAEYVESSELVQRSVESVEIQEFSKLALSYPISAECIEFLEPVPPCRLSDESAESRKFSKVALAYPSSPERVEFSEPVQCFPSSIESADTYEFSKLTPSYLPSARSMEVSSGIPEQLTIEFPENLLNIETPSETPAAKEDSANEQLSKEQFSKELFSSEHSEEEDFLNIQKSHSSDILKSSSILIAKSDWQEDIIDSTKSDVTTSTKNTENLTLDETVIDFSSIRIISNKEDTQEEICAGYVTPEAGTSKGFYQMEYDNDYDKYECNTDLDVKEVLHSEIMKTNASGDAMLRNLSSTVSRKVVMDEAVLIDIPEPAPSTSDIDYEEFSEILQETMQSRRRVRGPYNMMVTSNESFVTTIKVITTNKSMKQEKPAKTKKEGKVPPKPPPKTQIPILKVLKYKWLQKKRRIFTKKTKNRLKDSKVSRFIFFICKSHRYKTVFC